MEPPTHVHNAQQFAHPAFDKRCINHPLCGCTPKFSNISLALGHEAGLGLRVEEVHVYYPLHGHMRHLSKELICALKHA
eukprot:1137507-Pelagomonas_calceolata.AAC.3